MRRIDPKIWNGIVTIAATAFLACVLGYAFYATYITGCEKAADAGAMFGCLEFFLFRYQTLIGVAVALFVAVIAALPVWAQFRELRQQSAIQSYEMLRRYLTLVEEDRRLTLELKREAGFALILAQHMAGVSPGPKLLKEWSARCEERRDALTRLITVLEGTGVNKWGDSQAQIARWEMCLQATVLKAALSKAAFEIASEEESRTPDSPSTWNEFTVGKQSNELEKAANKYLALIEKESVRLAPLISNAERLATADETGL